MASFPREELSKDDLFCNSLAGKRNAGLSRGENFQDGKSELKVLRCLGGEGTVKSYPCRVLWVPGQEEVPS